MNNKKYELLTNDTIQIGTTTLYRIKALKDFCDVKAGDLGGYIEKEENLSHEGNCWVYDAVVYGNAKVYGNARVYDDAVVYGNAWVYGNAVVCGNADISSRDHIIWICNIGSRNDTITFMRNKDKEIIVKVGCYIGTIEEFKQRVLEVHGDNEHGKIYNLTIEMAKIKIKL